MKNCASCNKITRRQWISGMTAWAALAALTKRGDAQIASSQVNVQGTARACIFINLSGAPSHLDTFDVKDAPWNPADVNLRQHAGGIVLSNTLFPEISKIAGDLCLLRSVVSWEAAHERGQFYLQTAHPSNPAFVTETPHIGAVVALERGGSGPVPPFLTLNGTTRQGAGFLDGRVAPVSPPLNPGGLSNFEHQNLSKIQFDEKYRLLEDLDAALRAAPYDKSMADHVAFYRSARQLMYDPSVSAVFRFTADEERRYGGTQFARACIVARNAVKAKNGAVFINIDYGGWDTHQNMFDRKYAPNMYTLCNELDRGVGALVEDLKQSGDFKETLIVMMGEFGRTPGPLNGRGGRDHHKNAMSVAMLGGGVKGATIIGATDANGERVVEPGWKAQRHIVMEDIAATLYSALGINWTKSITDTPTGRRFEYVPFSNNYTAIDEVFQANA
ncbi:MAG TPA: DUF1501 domain-containing protein [Acidobacteriota bacterium]|jgi:hypothetical protein